jgi:hypothetical protein
MRPERRLWLPGCSARGADPLRQQVFRRYSCPPEGGAQVLVPANLPAPISSLTADPPCSIGSQSPYTGSRIYADILGERTGTCNVRAVLSNGAVMTASVSFQPLMCCGSSVGSATFTLPDAAAD